MTIIVAALILVTVEAFVRTDFFYELAPGSQAQEPIEIFNLGYRLIPDPDVIVLGNSLTRNAISSFEMTRLVGSDQPFLLNLSQSGGIMSDQLWLYKLYRKKIKLAETVVIGIDFRSFDNAANSEPDFSPRFRRYASLSQRLSVSDRSERISLVSGSIWKTWDSRQQIRNYIFDTFRLRFERQHEPEIDELGRFALRAPQTSTRVEDIVAYAENNYTFVEGVQYKAFTDLIRLAEEDSLNIILVEAPASSVYMHQLDLNIGDEIDRLYSAVERDTGMEIIRISLAENDCPAVDDCFIDYGHMNENGSKIYSRLLLDALPVPPDRLHASSP